jgi:hypothetical protein
VSGAAPAPPPASAPGSPARRRLVQATLPQLWHRRPGLAPGGGGAASPLHALPRRPPLPVGPPAAAPRRLLQLTLPRLSPGLRSGGVAPARPPQPAHHQQLAEVERLAVARFWEVLLDFAVMRAAPQKWLAQVPTDHPFLHTTLDRRRLVFTPPRRV